MTESPPDVRERKRATNRALLWLAPSVALMAVAVYGLFSGDEWLDGALVGSVLLLTRVTYWLGRHDGVRWGRERKPDPRSESYCHRCGGPNVVWSAPSPLWNAVMRGGSINGDEPHDGIVCPVCFVQLAEQQGVADFWRFYAVRVKVPLETVTPSGRVWDEDAWMFRDPRGVS